MSVVDFKKAKNTKQYPPEDFASLLELLSGAYKIVNMNLWFLWPYGLFLFLIIDGGIMPSMPTGIRMMITPGALMHSIFGLAFLQLVYTIFATFLVIGFRRPCFAELRGYIYKQRHKLLTFAAVVVGYYALFSISIVLIFPLVMLPLFFFLIEPICFFEDRNFLDVFGRSFRLMGGAKWSVLWVNILYIIGAMVVLFVAVLAPTLFLSMLFGGNGFISFVLKVVAGLAGGYIAMIFSVYKILLYLKRAKKVTC